MLGCVKAYIGLVETQGHGTLHLHMLIWLAELLKTKEFHTQVQQYIHHNFCASIPGVSTREQLQNIPSISDVAYSRPLKPCSIDYEEQIMALEKSVMCPKQLHTFTLAACL